MAAISFINSGINYLISVSRLYVCRRGPQAKNTCYPQVAEGPICWGSTLWHKGQHSRGPARLSTGQSWILVLVLPLINQENNIHLTEQVSSNRCSTVANALPPYTLQGIIWGQMWSLKVHTWVMHTSYYSVRCHDGTDTTVSTFVAANSSAGFWTMVTVMVTESVRANVFRSLAFNDPMWWY